MESNDSADIWEDYALSDGDPVIAREVLARHLTTMSSKVRLYADEPEFRASLAVVASLFQAEALPSDVGEIGLAVFRPDAIHGAKVLPTLEYFSAVGLMPVATAEVNIDEATICTLWRYQLNAATLSRVDLMKRIFAAGPSLLVLFRWSATRRFVDVPTSVVMSDLKGEGQPSLREGWELRSVLSSPHKLESYVHIADEPADVIRDAGLIVGAKDVSRLWRQWRRGEDVSRMLLSRATELGAVRGDSKLWMELRQSETTKLVHRDIDNLVNDSGSAGWWRDGDGGLRPSGVVQMMRDSRVLGGSAG